MNERISIADKKPEVKSHNHVPQIRRKNDHSQSMNSPVDRILFLQRTIGNQAVAKLMKSGALQAKLRIGEPGDIYEQEADRVAEQVMRMPEPQVSNETKAPENTEGNPIQHKCPDCRLKKEDEKELIRAKGGPGSTPEVTSELESSINAVRSGGQPLPESARAFYEPRFGHDFSQVRVHSGADAGQSAQDVEAKAYTVGHDIVFGTGQFIPGTQEGRQLIAHELTHVVQQASTPDPYPIQLKQKKEAPKQPFFQEALDALKETKKADVVKLTTGAEIDLLGRVPLLKKFIAVFEAIDKEEVKAVSELLDEFLRSDTKRLPIGFPSDALVNTMVTRLLLLSLSKEADSFRRWFLKHKREMASSLLPKDFLSERFLWEKVLDQLIGQIPAQGITAALKVLDALFLLFGQMRDEEASLDPEAIKKDRRSIREIGSLLGMPIVHNVSISVYFDALIELLKQAFIGIQTAYQVVLDQVIADLGTGRGDKYLKLAKDRLENKLKALIDPEEKKKKVGGITVEVTRLEFKKGGGKHLDFFSKGKVTRRRAIEVEFYDQEMLESLASENELNFARIFLIRREQILVLERIYGLERDKQGKPTAETQENAAAIARLGKTGLRLESDDDWRRFLLKKFEERKAKSNATEAFSAVIRLLESFLQAFTTHTPYNIKDFGENQLTKQFPRAMTGQLIHDCGVYALRIAYMLSLLREHKDLQLRFRFIILPVHVGLIITGKNLPSYIAHNDRIVIYTPEKLEATREAWIRTDEKGDPRKPTGKDEEEQFVAELSGAEFIPGVDLPFKLLEVPNPKGGPEAIKREVWSFYTKRVATVELFGTETRCNVH